MQAQAVGLAPQDKSTVAATTGMSHRTWLGLNEQRCNLRRIWSGFFVDFDGCSAPFWVDPPCRA